MIAMKWRGGMLGRRARRRRDRWVAIALWCSVVVGVHGCDAKKNALVMFEVQTAAEVPAFTQFQFSAPADMNIAARHVDAAGNRPRFTFGYYMPVGGTVTIIGQAI